MTKIIYINDKTNNHIPETAKNVDKTKITHTEYSPITDIKKVWINID